MEQARPELLEASDATIDDAVRYADPLVLRGVLYQLTGDEELLDIELRTLMVGGAPGDAPGRQSPTTSPCIRAKAAAFLKILPGLRCGPSADRPGRAAAGRA